jgi:LuxR family transcriptional regulator, maltose regulon positive regulatory protein
MMTIPPVETKLQAARPRERAVVRPRLDERLQQGSRTRLTLVSAPPGFGKTSLLASWLAARTGAGRTAWVSLDERDRDPMTFWTYVLLAVDRAVPGAASAALTELQTGRTEVETVLTGLLNELSVLPDDLNLVLDDYHLAEGPDIQQGLTFLLERLPPQVHLVLSTRADPALPLARWRARGELVEVRAADLRFTATEAVNYLNGTCSLDLRADDVAALDTRTEGWVAALQLAALSLTGREDASAFIAGFAGDDRYVVDYLADEVLDRQPTALRRFLLDTSVLERLTAPLCAAMTGRTDAAATLESLERQNLFLVPLDRNRRWYRYHHLFADVLRARLADERPEDVPDLHRRASDWFHDAAEPEAAVRHALAAGDLTLAADRVEVAIRPMLRERREGVVRRWVDQLPRDVIANRPVLAVGFIGALMASNEFDDVDRRLRDVERLLADPAHRPDWLVVDQAELTRLPAAVETYRAALALVGGDLSGAVDHADAALERAAADDDLSIASASAVSGLASWTNGDLGAAHRGYEVASDHLVRAGYVADVVGCAITLADIELTQGRLGAAQRTFENALSLAGREAVPPRGTADMYVGLSRVAYERGDLQAADDWLRRGDELGEDAGLPKNPYRWRVALAQLREAGGDPRTALALLDEAERVFVADFAPNVQPIPATRARMLAAAGEITPALAWARHSGLSAGDDLTYLREFEHVTLARVLLTDGVSTPAPHHLADATELLDRLLEAAEAGGRDGTVMEVLVLQSIARDAAGDSDQALACLDRAVRLAQPDGHVRVFHGMGAALDGQLLALLNALESGSPRGSHYIRRLLAAAGAPSTRETPAEDRQALVDPLSGRELDVLRLLRSDLDGPAIARQLGVSLATVRTHTQHIYAKLGVTSRRAAVRRAHQLNLFARTTQR